MKHVAFFISIVFALLVVSIASIAVAQIGSGYDLTWNTIDGGGGSASGGGYTLDHTLGQPDADTQSSSGYVLEGGFWSGANANVVPTPPLNHHLYLPLVRR